MLYGIDVSKWQTLDEEDFAKMEEGGIRFCLIRASVGLEVDEKFKRHLDLAIQHGMVAGAYHFMTPDDDPLEQAKVFRAEALHVDGWALDAETKKIQPWQLERFNAGFPERLGLYTRPSLEDHYARAVEVFDWHWRAKYTHDKVWLKELPTLDHGDFPAPVWQFTDRLLMGSSDGRERLDCNVFDGTQRDLLTYIGAVSL